MTEIKRSCRFTAAQSGWVCWGGPLLWSGGYREIADEALTVGGGLAGFVGRAPIFVRGLPIDNDQTPDDHEERYLGQYHG